jgi:hypothetical protein
VTILTVDVWRASDDRSGAELRGAAGLPVADVGEVAPRNGEPCYTNVSNTRGCSLLVAATVRIGVDAEQVRTRPLVARLARRCMNGDEHAEWQRAADPDRAFLAHWTRVEAYLKAIGVGVRGGLLTRAPAGWSLIDLPLGAEHVGAIAVESPRPIALCFHELH